MKFLDCILVNPSIKFEKDKVYPFVDMASVSTDFRLPDAVYSKVYDGGVKFENGDTVVARIEPCLQNGKRFFVKDINQGFGSTEFLVFRPKDEQIDPLYLYYFMNTNYIRQSMINSMSGATGRQRVNNDIFGSIELDLPDKNIQVKIASILSSYDNLIENNQKQIKLLEEAAQRLYKEWFVDLRFPGHEDVEIFDGLPVGWEEKRLDEIASVNTNYMTNDYNESFIDYIDLSSVSKGTITNVKRYSINDAPGRAKRIAKNGDIIWGMVRPNLRSYALILNPEYTNVYSTGFAIISSNKVPYSFLYCLVTRDEFVGYLINCTNGAAYPAVKPSHFEEAKIIVPENSVLNRFDKMVRPIFERISLLNKQCKFLQEARDRLLPKLMRGEVEV